MFWSPSQCFFDAQKEIDKLESQLKEDKEWKNDLDTLADEIDLILEGYEDEEDEEDED